jgi:hypothetical protein
MKRIGMGRMGNGAVTLILLAGTMRAADREACASLKLDDGSSEVKTGGPEEKVDQLENHGAKTGLFLPANSS